MSKEWIRGYGQRYRHMVVRTEVTPHYKRTHFACGKTTDYTLDCVFELTETAKCPLCLDFERNNVKAI
ncbi:hypothetical protein K7J14_02340 [Treponema zuelzerae]|mgnify:CR=1 FL=1|uniref:Uncharacterized protein n=1 Tax=Teretinema zuelzerae TaxID=156 RepID=A0AAE3EFP4_9SPIR|nr:hypothetical protein [Teretinema zuelzerae]MCD1653536.1 hypothetical protein [Teretinema zuelzerae]